jgi:hypothetical protein
VSYLAFISVVSNGERPETIVSPAASYAKSWKISTASSSEFASNLTP